VQRQINGTARVYPTMHIIPLAHLEVFSNLSAIIPLEIEAIRPTPERIAALTNAYIDF